MSDANGIVAYELSSALITYQDLTGGLLYTSAVHCHVTRDSTASEPLYDDQRGAGAAIQKRQ